MASFREMFFTPAEFANIAKIDRNAISVLESEGLLKTTKRRMGNVDRKMIALEDMQNFFRSVRGRHGDRLEADAANEQLASMGQTNAEAAGAADASSVAAATTPNRTDSLAGMPMSIYAAPSLKHKV